MDHSCGFCGAADAKFHDKVDCFDGMRDRLSKLAPYVAALERAVSEAAEWVVNIKIEPCCGCAGCRDFFNLREAIEAVRRVKP